MTGADQCIAMRLAGRTPATVHLMLGHQRRASDGHVYRDSDGRLSCELCVPPNEDGALLDLRCCQGAAVLVHAETYDAGIAAFMRVLEFSPAEVTLAAADTIARWTPTEGVNAWEM